MASLKMSIPLIIATLLPYFARALINPSAATSLAASTFDASSNTNMAVYWGQGPNQQRLSHFCADSNIDIIPIAFLNQFPDQTGGYPGDNFGNQCDGTYYKNPDGSTSKLLKNCPYIGSDMKTCQQMGKKILLSLGGAYPSNQHINSQQSAVNFANFLWRAFGPNKEKSGSTFPRPFGDAAVDGFDFDIENVLVSGENKQDLYYGYSTMINTLRQLYASDSKTRYISGAPQCVVPDAHLADAIQNSWFDFLFVQFYNTPQCSARAYFDHTYGAYGGPATDVSYDTWVTFVSKHSKNTNAKILLGLPASTTVVNDKKMYLQPSEAKQIIEHFQCKYPGHFGGVMIYEATYSEQNVIGGKSYADVLKGYLTGSTCAKKPTKVAAKEKIKRLVFIGTAATGVSSSPPYPAGTGIYPAPGGTRPVVSLSVISRSSYVRSSGSASNSSNHTVPHFSGTGIAPTPTPTTSSHGTAPFSQSFGTPGTDSSGPSSLASLSSTSPKSILSSSSNIPYPLTNTSTAKITTQSTSTSETNGVSLTPESGSPMSTYESHSVTATTSTSAGASASSKPQLSTEEATTTVYTTTYTTTCPVTETTTFGSSTILHTSSTVSTITETITVCPKCTASASPFTVSSPNARAGATPASASKSTPVSTQELVATVIVYTITTTCPVTHTITSGSSEIVQTTHTVSAVVKTTTTIICKNCPTEATSGPQVPSKPGSGRTSQQASPPPPEESHHGSKSPIEQGPAGSQTPGSSIPSSGANSPVEQQQSGSHPQPAVASPSAEESSAAGPVIQYQTLTLVPEPITHIHLIPHATAGAEAAGATPGSSPAGVSKPGPGSGAAAGAGAGPGAAVGTGMSLNTATHATAGIAQPSIEAFKGEGGRVTMSGGMGMGMMWAVAVGFRIIIAL